VKGFAVSSWFIPLD